jgi:UDP-N-acetylmuramoyl-L-alanyl-D-glutamate--2,6-diaminopimelate ligase
VRLAELASGFDLVSLGGNPEINGITEDSRRVMPGMLFVAIPGTTQDGHAYIREAIGRGAVAVVVEHSDAVPAAVTHVRVPSSRAALAELAGRFFGKPGDDLSIIGFTGTFGKTSTSEILRALLEAGGQKTGVLGSLGARYSGFHVPPGGLTTPAPVELHRTLRGLKDAGASTVILEVTSHALRLDRARGLRFQGGLLAAIMPGEHTDFHRSYDDYVAAKRNFLDYLSADAVLAFDADNRAACRLAAEAKLARPVGFSFDGHDAALKFCDVLVDHRGATFSIAGSLTAESGERLHSTLLGPGHLRNVALALTYALAAGVPLHTTREVLASLRPLRRRMERYDIDGRMVLDDTAAHPESFRATFEVAGLIPHERLTVVYCLRGNRGIDINQRNAVALADLTAIHGVDSLIVTGAADCTGQADRATAAEIDATRQALMSRGGRIVWHDSLRASADHAIADTSPGDLIVLIGAQGMDRGRTLLESAGGRLSS